MAWQEKNQKLTQEFTFPNFSEALIFVNKVGKIAEEMNHHPDICIHHYKKVTIEIYHHDDTPLQQVDHNLANEIQKLTSTDKPNENN